MTLEAFDALPYHRRSIVFRLLQSKHILRPEEGIIEQLNQLRVRGVDVRSWFYELYQTHIAKGANFLVLPLVWYASAHVDALALGSAHLPAADIFFGEFGRNMRVVGETGPILDSSTTLDSSNNKVAITQQQILINQLCHHQQIAKVH